MRAIPVLSCAFLFGALLFGNRHLVETGASASMVLSVRGHLGMFAPGHRRGHEDPQMADFLVDHVDDALAPDADFGLVGIEIGDPVERLGWRGDIVAPTGKDHDGRSDRLDIEHAPARQPRFAARQLVAQKLFDDPADLVLVHEVEAAPPALELQELAVARRHWHRDRHIWQSSCGPD
jgi:hypothetical protein